MKFSSFALCVAAVFVGSVSSAHAFQTPAEKTQVTLDVPAMKQVPPPGVTSGWCGEAAVQMIAMYYGCYFPQSVVNKAGNPTHPDLYSNELPVALNKLGFTFNEWPLTKGTPSKFLAAVKEEIGEGRPVLIGVKVYPSQTPEAGFDHFCVAAGFDSTGLRINDTWIDSGRIVTSEQLLSTQKGLSFNNPIDIYLGLAVKNPMTGNLAVRLNTVPKSSTRGSQQVSAEVKLLANVSGMTAGQGYQLLRYKSVSDMKREMNGEVVTAFTATGSTMAIPITVSVQETACFATHSIASPQP